ncbi:Cyclophilin-like peptidyl-prolyl cis-trans isomerase family protein isoform 1 [Gossypium australe]|uniref:Cyclophilin-like peptidyl-prolyl cis-trans isomerase family protein isoform 1 n=1 Tax=Gossypium australe TaxID=47621 RepID=A0A5B6W560_9ROSI|nr:Cyclophilin-like peptidyl-prolyl cis-trans isomerase family protein isoform 1 [Gossypium australe]
MATGATAEMIRCVLESSLVMQEIEVERRPYHRNCSCALHNLKGVCSSAFCSRSRNVCFSKKKTLNDCSLSMATSQSSSLGVGAWVKSMESKASMGVSFKDIVENISEF